MNALDVENGISPVRGQPVIVWTAKINVKAEVWAPH